MRIARFDEPFEEIRSEGNGRIGQRYSAEDKQVSVFNWLWKSGEVTRTGWKRV